MADITADPVDVGVGTGATIELVQCGEAIDQGTFVYQDSTNSKYFKATCAGTLAQATVKGVIVTKAAAIDDYAILVKSGPVTLALPTTLTQGTTYVLSNSTAGKMMPVADLITTGWYLSHVGTVNTDTDFLVLKINNTGVQIP